MGSKTGLAAQLGIAAESSFATRTAPARFLEFLSEGIALDIQRQESGGLRAGRRFTRAYHENRKGAAGPIALEVPTKGFGLVAKHILGAIATTTPTDATIAKDHTATPGDHDGKSFTIQIGRPSVNGTVNAYDYLGCKIASAEFSNSVDGILQVTLNIDAVNEDDSQSLATASYPTGLDQFFFTGASLKLDDVGIDVRDFSCTIDNGLKTDRYFLRNSSLKKEQIEDTQARSVTGTFTADFENETLYDRFKQGVEGELVALWRNPVEIETDLYPELEISMGRVRFDGATPNVGGADILTQSVPYKALEPVSGSTIAIRYRTSDATP